MTTPVSAAPVRAAAIVMLSLTLVQAALGGLTLGGGETTQVIHRFLGYTVFVIAVVTAVLAWRYVKAGGPPKVSRHALGMPVLAFIQVGLGEAEVTWAHVLIGLLFLGGTFALVAMVETEIQDAKIAESQA